MKIRFFVKLLLLNVGFIVVLSQQNLVIIIANFALCRIWEQRHTEVLQQFIYYPLSQFQLFSSNIFQMMLAAHMLSGFLPPPPCFTWALCNRRAYRNCCADMVLMGKLTLRALLFTFCLMYYSLCSLNGKCIHCCLSFAFPITFKGTSEWNMKNVKVTIVRMTERQLSNRLMKTLMFSTVSLERAKDVLQRKWSMAFKIKAVLQLIQGSLRCSEYSKT